jgi:hypothetical protein
MSRFPSRGPLDQVGSPRIVRDGTTPPVNGKVPGPLCTTRPSGIRDFARRVGNLRDAFLLGIRKYAYGETVAKLGEDSKRLVDSLWPGFVQALEVYAWSIGVGATAFGIAGGILGEGFGAAPGAMLGAEIGAEVATGLLSLLGIKFLAEYVLSHMKGANEHFGAGFRAAWAACGNRPPLDLAAREFGRGFAELFSLVLEAAVVWLLRKGLKAGLQELNRSKAGQAIASYAEVEYFRRKLGVTDAPTPREGIATTLKFFEEQTRTGKLKPMEEKDLLNYGKAMDFSAPVESISLKPGKILSAYRDPKSPFGFFYTEPGTYLDRLGIDYVTERRLIKELPKPTIPVDRGFFRYRVKAEVEVLKSRSSGVRAYDTDRPVPGGGTQYFIPKAWEVLEVIQAPPEGISTPVVVPKRPDDSKDD